MTFSMYFLFLLPQVFSALLVCLAQGPSGLISLSCGSPRGKFFHDEETSHRNKSEKQKWNLRSFPRGVSSCFTLILIRGDKYLIRTTFLHGGYDDNPSTQFDLHLGHNRWDTASTTNESKSKTFEIIHQLTTDRLQVCLVKSHDSMPTRPRLIQNPCRLSSELTLAQSLTNP